MQKRKPQKEQLGRFIETARELGCDEDEASFREKLAKIARQKPTVGVKQRRAIPKKDVNKPQPDRFRI